MSGGYRELWYRELLTALGREELYFRLLRHFERVVNFDTQVSYDAFEFARNPKLDQIARSQFAVDGQLEECQFPDPVGELQSDPNSLDLL
jgi:hypothetical protein